MRLAGAALVVLVAFGASCRDLTGIDEYTFPFPECVPGAEPEPCYEGPPGTENVGRCRSGTVVCNADGTGLEACNGVGPLPLDDCAATPTADPALDANCDGTVDVCRHAIEWVRFVDTAIAIGGGTDGAPGPEAGALVAGAYPGGFTTIAGFGVPDAGPGDQINPPGYGGYVLSVRATKEFASLWSSTDGQSSQNELITHAAGAGGGLWAVGLDMSPNTPPNATLSGALRFYKLDPSTGQVALKNSRFTGNYDNPRIAARTRPEGGADVWLGATVEGTWDLDVNAPPEEVQASGNDVLLVRVSEDGTPGSSIVLAGANDQYFETIALGAQSGEVVVAGCHETPPGTGCGALPAEPGYFVARYDAQGNCLSHAASTLGQAPSADSCRVGAALAEPFEGPGVFLAAHSVATSIRISDCTSGSCTEIQRLDASGTDAKTELLHLGTDSLGNAYVVFVYNGTLSAMTAIGMSSQTRTSDDVAVAKLHRDPASGAWQIWWLETLSRGDDDVRFSSGVTAAVTPAGFTYVLGMGRNNIGDVPGPDPIPSQTDKLFLARISP